MHHLVRVKVTPSAKRECIESCGSDRYTIYVKEPPARGLATTRVKVLIARLYNVPIASVRLSTGAQSRSKTFVVTI